MKEPWDHLDEATLDAWRDGGLEPADAARVEAHLGACSRCAGLLADMEAFEETVDRGYRAAEVAGREPDWAAQRAAIVDRTSGRRRAARGLWRWAPQAAVVAVAVVAVVVVVERGVRGPGEARRAVEAPAAGAAGASRPEALERGGAALEERREEVAAPARNAAAPDRKPAPAAPAPAPRTAPAEPAGAAADQAAAPAEEAGRVEALQKAAAAPAPPLRRFRAEARAALAARDTTAARRALGFLRDSVDAAGLGDADRAAARALADSLAELLARTP